MRLKRYILPAAAVAVLLCVFFLPNAVAGVMDARRLDNLIIIDAQSISFDADPRLSLQERIALASSPNAESLAYPTGQVMDTRTAEDRAVRELVRFFRDSPFEFASDELTAEGGAAAFVVDSEDPSINMIIWEFKIFDINANEATVTIDDETGIILKLIYQHRGSYLQSEEFGVVTGRADAEIMPDLSGGNTRESALALCEIMTEYYGHPVRLGDYQLSGNIAYYRADIYGGGLVIPMYGVIRSPGFTMNERV